MVIHQGNEFAWNYSKYEIVRIYDVVTRKEIVLLFWDLILFLRIFIRYILEVHCHE